MQHPHPPTPEDLQDEDKWMAAGPVVRYVGFSPSALNELVRKGRLPYITFRHQRFYHRADVEALRQQRLARIAATPPTPPAN